MTRKEFLSLGGRVGASRCRGAKLLRLSRLADFASDVLHTPQINRIHRYIEQHKAEHLAKVQADIRQPSVSSWNLGIQEMAERMRQAYQAIGCREAEVVKTDGNPGIWAWYDGGARKTISTYMMYDTQPYDEKEWSSPPLAANLVPMDPFPRGVDWPGCHQR